jgi:hypothetical protein
MSTSTHLLQKGPSKKRELTEKQSAFLDALFENGGDFRKAAEVVGYSEKSISWLRESLADEIIEKSRAILAGGAIKAANRLVNSIDDVDLDRHSNTRLSAAESVLNRIGLGKQEQINHTVQAVHGVVLLPPKKEMVIEHGDD